MAINDAIDKFNHKKQCVSNKLSALLSVFILDLRQ